MKKHLLVLAFAGISAAVSAQNFSIIDAAQVNVIGTTQTYYIDQDITDARTYTVTNSSSGSMTIKVHRTVMQLNTPTAVTSFCTNTNCYSASQNWSTNVTLAAGGHFDLVSDYFADSTGGMGRVRYSVIDQANQSDSVTFDIIYNPSPAGISAPALVKASVSNPAPNPASSVFSVNYKLGTANPSGTNKMVIYNMLGARVLETRVEETEGMVKMDVSSLESGIYFCSLETDGKTLATRRLVVTH